MLANRNSQSLVATNGPKKPVPGQQNNIKNIAKICSKSGKQP